MKPRIDLKNTDHIKCFGSSMYPVLHDGDIVYYRQTPFKQIQTNDIVIANLDGTYVTHRVIYKNDQYLVTKGDNNKKADPKIQKDSIIGTVFKVKRGKIEAHPETAYLLQSTQYLHEIKEFLTHLEGKKIPYVFLKGLLLHLRYQQAHPRRMYLDFDILVDFKHHEKIHSILNALGYKKKDAVISPIHKKLLDKPIETTYVKKTSYSPVFADIHYEPVFLMTQIGRLDELYPQNLIDKLHTELFSASESVEILGKKYQMLSTLYLILYLALHFFHHNFKGVHRLEIMHEVISSLSEKDKKHLWNNLAWKLIELKLHSYTYGTFLLLKDYFHTDIPDDFMQLIRPSKKHHLYLQDYLKKHSVFDEFTRSEAGIQLFKNIYFLSYRPWYKKCLVFFRPAVMFMILWLGTHWLKKSI